MNIRRVQKNGPDLLTKYFEATFQKQRNRIELFAVAAAGKFEVGGKCSDVRHSKYRGTRRTEKYAAVTSDEDNTADGRFPPASRAGCSRDAVKELIPVSL
jgi:hypothetical protein